MQGTGYRMGEAYHGEGLYPVGKPDKLPGMDAAGKAAYLQIVHNLSWIY